MTVTDLLGKDAGLTVLTVLHSPGASSNCHAVQVTERAASGQAAALSLVSYNTDSGALQIRSSGPYLQAFDSSNTLKFQVSNAGGITATTLASTGAVTLSSTLAVSGDTTLSGALGVSGYTTLAGGQANGDWVVFGNLGFYGTTATAKQTVSGSRGGNAALASLLTALAAYGLITDSSSA